MNFRPNYPIYLQVADYICEKVLTGQWLNGGKLPSVKELSMTTSVNPNTVIKALAWLQDNGILLTHRGIGYFLTDDAMARTLELKRRQFIDDVLPEVFNSMNLLGLNLDELATLFRNAQKKAQRANNGNRTADRSGQA